MLFTGGCSLLFLSDFAMRGGDGYVNVPMILVIGGVPFLIGLVVWWLAAKVGRASAPGSDQ